MVFVQFLSFKFPVISPFQFFVSKIKIPPIDSKEQAGKKGERIVNDRIQKLISNKLKGQGISHPKFIFFVYKQDTCEIDNLVVTKGGIFIIETNFFFFPTFIAITKKQYYKDNYDRNKSSKKHNITK